MAFLDYAPGLIEAASILGEKTPYEELLEKAEDRVKFLGTPQAEQLRAAREADRAASAVLTSNTKRGLDVQDILGHIRVRNDPDLVDAITEYSNQPTTTNSNVTYLLNTIRSPDYGGITQVKSNQDVKGDAVKSGRLLEVMNVTNGRWYMPDPKGAQIKTNNVVTKISFGIKKGIEAGLTQDEAYKTAFGELPEYEKDIYTNHWSTFTDSLTKTVDFFKDDLLPTFPSVMNKLQRLELQAKRQGATAKDLGKFQTFKDEASKTPMYTRAQYINVLREIMEQYITAGFIMDSTAQQTFMKSQILKNFEADNSMWNRINKRLEQKYPHVKAGQPQENIRQKALDQFRVMDPANIKKHIITAPRQVPGMPKS